MMLGNLTVEEIENRLGIEFPKETKEFMRMNWQLEANDIKPGKWHCFDIPFNLVCGDMATAQKIFDSVKEKSSQCKTQLQFSITDKKEN